MKTMERWRSSIGRFSGLSIRATALGPLFAAILLACAASIAFGDQTREECDKCCENAGHDEYYLEQCKLKCFRNPDHCTGQASKRAPAARTEAPPKAAQPPRSASPPVQPAPPPQAGPPEESVPQAGPPRASEGEVVFRWPNPLNLTPGKEWEAAGQILGANGMSPQHPAYPAALKAVESVLIDFARKNPGGGSLPTAQLVRILMQYR